MNGTAMLLILFLTCCIVSVFYWHVVRETVLTRVRFRLFARRDLLRRLALERKEDPKSFAYQELEEFICKTVGVVPAISLISLLISTARNPNPTSENVQKFRREASPELKQMMNLTITDALLTMMLNSPILVIVGTILVLLVWIAGRFKRTLALLYRHAEHFLDQLPSGDHKPLAQAV